MKTTQTFSILAIMFVLAVLPMAAAGVNIVNVQGPAGAVELDSVVTITATVQDADEVELAYTECTPAGVCSIEVYRQMQSAGGDDWEVGIGGFDAGVKVSYWITARNSTSGANVTSQLGSFEIANTEDEGTSQFFNYQLLVAVAAAVGVLAVLLVKSRSGKKTDARKMDPERRDE